MRRGYVIGTGQLGIDFTFQYNYGDFSGSVQHPWDTTDKHQEGKTGEFAPFGCFNEHVKHTVSVGRKWNTFYVV